MTTNNGIGYCSVAGLFSDLYLYNFNYGSVPNMIVDAADRGVQVINMSIVHSGGFNQTWANAINYAYEKGVLIVAIAGNCHFDLSCSAYQYPASYDNVFAVASLRNDDVRNDNSISGVTCETSYNDKVDISAPGMRITSTGESNTYGYNFRCTSAAAPIVSGVAALLFTINPYFSPDQVGAILKSTAYDIYQIPGNQPYIGLLGAGRVNAFGAVSCATDVSTSLPLTGNLNGVYNRFFVNISNANILNSLTIRSNNLTINGSFEAGLGTTLDIGTDLQLGCPN